MRIVVKGTSSPEELADVFDCLIARLLAAGGGEGFWVNIYLTPNMAGATTIFVPDNGLSDERIEIMGGPATREFAEHGMDRAITAGKFVPKHKHFSELGILYAYHFCKKMDVSVDFYKNFLGMEPSRADDIFHSKPPIELTAAERSRLDALIEFTLVISKLFGKIENAVEWFRGPYPDSRFQGASPLEQIQAGGPQVAHEIGRTLKLGFHRRLRGRDIPWPPPAHFDQIFLRPSAVFKAD